MTTPKRVLITGATGQLGQHLAVALTRAGYEVLINYRTNKKTAKKLAALVGVKAVYQADVTKEVAVRALFKKIGRVDVLINAVGDFIYKPLAKTTEAEFTACLTSNLLSAWHCTKAALPGMRKQKYGRIINFGSAGCDRITARPLTTPYYIAKTALLMLTKSLAKEEGGKGITINMISPGVLPHGVRPPGAPLISYEDITNKVLFILAEKNNNLTGKNITISKGWRPE